MNGESTDLHLKATRGLKDLLIIYVVAVLVFALAVVFDIHDNLVRWLRTPWVPQLDEIFTVLAVLSFALGIFALRRWRELRAEVAERKQAEEALHASEERFRALIENSSDIISLLSSEGTILYESPSVSRVLGYGSDELVGRHVTELLHPDDCELVMRTYAEILRTPGSKATAEVRYRHKDGSWRWMEGVGANLLSQAGVQAIIVNYRDISERKQAEEALAKERNLLRTLIDSLPDVIFSKDTESRFVIANARFTRGSGASPMNEIVGKTDFDFLPREQAAQYYNEEQEILRSGEPVIGREEAVIGAEGHKRWISTTKVPLKDDEGKIVGLVGMNRDITERKRAEEALRDSEWELKEAQRLGNIGHWEFDVERQQVRWSDMVFAIYERDPKLGPPAVQEEAEYYSHEDAECLRRCAQQTIETGKPYETDVRLKLPGGRVKEVVATGVAVRDSHGRVTRLLGTVQDITERKHAEQALRYERNLLRTLIDNLPDEIYVKDTACRKTVANVADVRSMGCQSEAEVLGKDDFDIYPEEIAAKFYADDQLVLQTGQPVLNRDEYVLDAEGKKRWLSTSKVPLRGEQGRIIGLVAIGRDITERKRTEEALAESELKFRTLFKSMRQGFYLAQILYDEDGAPCDYEYLDVNSAFEQIMGLRQEQIIGRTYTELVPPDPESGWLDCFKRVAITGKPENYTFFSKIFDSYFEVYAFKPEEGKFCALVKDITDSKRAEETLRESEGKYRTLFESASEAITIVSLDGTISDCNSEAGRISRLHKEDLVGKHFSELGFFKEEDLPKSAELLQQLVSGRDLEPFEIEVPIDGNETTWVEVFPSLLKKNNQVYALQVITRDVTERKRAEEALRYTERLFHTVWDSSADGMRLTNGDGTILAVNEAFCKMVGKSRTELEGKSLTVIYQEDRAEHIVRRHRERFASRTVESHFERQMRLWDDRKIWFEVANSFLEIESHPPMLLGLFRDVTERKRAEEALQESEEKYRLLVDNANETIIVAQDGMLKFVNRMAIELMNGYSEQELTGRPFSEFIHPDDRDMVVRNYLTRIKGETLRSRYMFRLIDRAGLIKWVEINAVLIEWEGRAATLNLLNDITERKRAEAALEREQGLLRALIQNIPSEISVKDTRGRIILANRKAVSAFGVAREEEVVDKTDFDFVKPHLAERHQAEERAILDSGIPLVNDEVTKLGSTTGELEKCMLRTKIPLEDSQGQRIGLLCINQDITERKRVEEALRSSEAQLSNALKIAHLGAWEYDVASDLFTFNDHFYAIFRTTAEQVGGYTMRSADYAQRFVHPDDALQVGAEIRKALEATDPHFSRQLEHRIIYADGEIGYITVRFFVVKDDQGRTVRTYGVNQDITERRLAEERLRESEEKYRSLIENSLEGIGVSKENRVIYANKALLSIFGYEDLEEFVATPLLDHVAPESQSKIRETLTKAHKGEPYDKEFRYKIVRKDGEIRDLEIATDHLRIGGDTYTQSTFRDITERKRAEEALRESEERYRRLFEESKDVIYLTTPEGKWMDINPAGVELFGFSSKEELMSTAVIGLYCNPEDRLTFQRCVEEQGFVKDYEATLKRRGGETLNVLLTSDAVRDDVGRIVAYRGIIRDVTKQKQLEKQLIQVQKMESIGTLAGGIAHDFNNILQIVRGYASFLRSGTEKPERIAQSVAAIEQAVKRGADLVRQILTFARKTDVAFGPVSVNLIIQEFEKMLSETFPKMINFSFELDKDVPLIIADATQLNQLLLNLCVNARDAMPDGGTISLATEVVSGSSLQKRFRGAREERYVHIDVSDRGVGMDDALLSRVFEPFFTTKEKGRGTGLGLAVVWGIMESHKGFINVESEVGGGTTFHLYFPVPQDLVKSPDARVETEKETAGGSETILVAEDEEVQLELITDILEAKGYKVFAAKDGVETINIYRQYKDQISLVLTDFDLPKLRGLEVLQVVRDMNADTKVVVASGYLEPNVKSELMKAGARAFIQKPFDSSAILKKVREVLDENGRSSHVKSARALELSGANLLGN